MRGKSRNLRVRQAGFTLIEIMVSLVIGLFVIGIGLKVYLMVKQTYRLQQAVVEVQNQGQFLMEYVTNDARRAGWRAPQSTVNFSEIQISGSSIFDGSEQNNSDAISIRYSVAPANIAYDCAGRKKLIGEVVINQYSLSNNILRCNGQEILKNVENIQLQYGIDRKSPEFDGMIDDYINAEQFGNRVMNILAIKIAILLRSSEQVLDKGKPQIIQVLDYQFKVAADRKLRRLFQKVIFLPNNRFDFPEKVPVVYSKKAPKVL